MTEPSPPLEPADSTDRTISLDTSSPPAVRFGRRWWWGLTASVLFHGVLLALLVAVPYRLWTGVDAPSPTTAARTESPAKPIKPSTDPSSKPQPTPSPSSDSSSVPIDDPSSDAPLPKVRTPDDLTGRHVAGKLAEASKQLEGLSDDEKLEKLESLTRQLDQQVSAKSVEELAAKFQGWMGVKSRAAAPAADRPEGRFNHNSAQFHDVRREADPQGGWRYIGVMLDAEGRTQEVPLAAEDGVSLHRTFQLLKSSPLADQVYRRMTMPLLDKLMQTQSPSASQSPAPSSP